MSSDRYQRNYSAIAPVILDAGHKAPKVRKMLAVLEAAGVLREESRRLAVDVGASSGLFAGGLSPYFERVLACDIDDGAINAGRAQAPGNTHFVLSDSERLPLPPASADLVVCNHVYEHVPSADRLFDEIHRVLRPGGACYLGAASRLTVVEPHYRLPFLSWLPKWAADPYMRLAGRGDRYYENLRTWGGIRRLLDGFDWVDYTLPILRHPDRFHARDLLPPGSWIEHVPEWVWRASYRLLPTYILVLRKRRPRRVP